MLRFFYRNNFEIEIAQVGGVPNFVLFSDGKITGRLILEKRKLRLEMGKEIDADFKCVAQWKASLAKPRFKKKLAIFLRADSSGDRHLHNTNFMKVSSKSKVKLEGANIDYYRSRLDELRLVVSRIQAERPLCQGLGDSYPQEHARYCERITDQVESVNDVLGKSTSALEELDNIRIIRTPLGSIRYKDVKSFFRNYRSNQKLRRSILNQRSKVYTQEKELKEIISNCEQILSDLNRLKEPTHNFGERIFESVDVPDINRPGETRVGRKVVARKCLYCWVAIA